MFDRFDDVGGGLLEALETAISGLTGVDADGVDDLELHGTVVALATLRSRLEAVHCQLIAAWDRRLLWAADGSKAAAARLAR